MYTQTARYADVARTKICCRDASAAAMSTRSSRMSWRGVSGWDGVPEMTDAGGDGWHGCPPATGG
ncbi:hypothetical protein QTQ03_05970 [Micromonospora sp. WMMA1363]|uniref:hypothetical protein n=1 Tax=Micromonospora sp. WMMA1363 TaxID=3053985 RepID=UPI00259CD7BF|nr:hypothetical protein [Micromonospora sp. WMMA1363]MDM4719165.1 hypothetical protein [Micromonospora sp. WMMA1363]